MTGRKLPIQVLGALLIAPVGALTLVAWLQWSPTAAGRGLSALLTALAGASAIAALVYAVDAVRIRPGNRVHIEHWGGADPLRGTVRLVEPSAFLKISALGVEEKRVNVIVDFDDPWETRNTLGDGFRIEARIVVDQTEADAMKVPFIRTS